MCRWHGRKNLRNRSWCVSLKAFLKDVHSLLGKNEDRSDFLRQAAELEIAIRRLDIYPELQGYLTANETIADFCAKAVKRAILARIASLTNEDIEPVMSNTEKLNLNKKI